MIRDYNVEFPVKPERKPWNATAYRTFPVPDMNDIYIGRDYGGQFMNDDADEKDFQTQLEAYS
jgi:hypothetical protein